MPPKPSKSKPHRSKTPEKSTKKSEQPTPSAAADADSIRKSGRKRKVRYADSFASISSAHRQWTDEDTLVILNGAVDFKSKTGTTPTPTLIGEFFDSIKGSLSSAEITPEMVLNRLRRLRRKFNEMPPDGPATDHDRIVYELSAKAWGTTAAADEDGGEEQEIESEKEGHDDDDDDDDDDDGDDYPYLTRGVKEYAKMFGGGFPVEILDVLDPAKKRELEEKYKRLSKVDMKFRRNRCILNKELYDALFAGEAKEG